jgi:Ser/Thr protein kinase RdoA (MazF antagonist)
MHAELIRRFDRSVVPRDAVIRWAADPATLQHVGDSQNFVYRFRHPGGQECYLRLAHESHRTRALVEAEADFVEHLARERCAVAAPVPAADGRFVHTIATPIGQFYAAAFYAVHGQPVKWGNDAENRRILFERGELLAEIHDASQSFHPAGPKRFRWDDGDLFTRPDQVLAAGASEPRVWAEYHAVRAWLEAQSESESTFGLVHGDLLSSNCLRSGGKSIAFDFDDCCYQWFMFDLAVAISAGRDLPEKYRRDYLCCLLDGYATRRALPRDTREQIDWFCRLSAIYRYALLAGETDATRADAAQRQELERRKRAVLDRVRWS